MVFFQKRKKDIDQVEIKTKKIQLKINRNKIGQMAQHFSSETCTWVKRELGNWRMCARGQQQEAALVALPPRSAPPPPPARGQKAAPPLPISSVPHCSSAAPRSSPKILDWVALGVVSLFCISGTILMGAFSYDKFKRAGASPEPENPRSKRGIEINFNFRCDEIKFSFMNVGLEI